MKANEPSDAPRSPGTTTRRRFLRGTAGTLSAVLAAPGGFYDVVGGLAQTPRRPAHDGSSAAQEQYLLQGTRVINVAGSGLHAKHGPVAVEVPALHDRVITAKLKVQASAKALREAQQHLESVLAELEREFPPTPGGVGIALAWGLPYFQHYIPSLGTSSDFFAAGTRYPAYLPMDLVTSKTEGRTVYAVQEARTFPSDDPPAGFGPVRLEENDVAVLLRSDSLAHILTASGALFGHGGGGAGDLFTVTSIRQGFSGGGFFGEQGLPSKLALAAKIPGAESIPLQAQAFLGFATTLVSNMGPGNIANLETLPGYTDQWPAGYFKQGTTMHLSHLYEDLEAWYDRYPAYRQRVEAMQYPGIHPTPATGTVALQPPGQSLKQVEHGLGRHGSYGHSGSLSVVDSTAAKLANNYGVKYPAGTTIPVRGDFNTLDNPFQYTSDPAGDRFHEKPAAGLHFLMFQPTIGFFNQVRLSMDGHYSGKKLGVSPRSHHAGINSVLHTTHRQNYLVPPRRHRSFPLVEFLA